MFACAGAENGKLAAGRQNHFKSTPPVGAGRLGVVCGKSGVPIVAKIPEAGHRGGGIYNEKHTGKDTLLYADDGTGSFVHIGPDKRQPHLYQQQDAVGTDDG